MKRNCLALAVVLFVGLCCVSACFADNVLVSSKYHIVITASNGLSENRLITYEAWIRDNRWEEGHASKPLKGKPFDTRRGYQDISTWVKRSFSVITITGEVTDDSKFKQIYNVQSQSKGGWAKGDIVPGKWIGKHKKLSDCTAEFNENYSRAADYFKGKFDEIVYNDLNNVLPDEIKKNLPGAMISKPAVQ